MLPWIHQQMASEVARMLTERCTISRETLTADEYGATANVWQTVAEDVPCRVIRAERSKLIEFGVQETTRDTYHLITPTTTTLATGQRVIMNGATYEILGLRQGLTDDVFHEALIGRLI